MQSSQQQIISRVASWLQKQKPVWLCTILKTWGSSPRPVGAMMACTLDGELVGSISGGCIEEDFLKQLRDGSLKSEYDKHGKPFTVKYGVTAAEQARLKLPCGGQLHVLLEYIEPTAANIQVFARLSADLENHTKVSRIVNLQSGVITANAQSGVEPVIIAEDIMTHSLSPMYRLLLLGAGDVAKFVAEMALALEYDVTLCDPRPDYLDNWHVDGVELTSRLPDDVVRERFSNPYSGIIALAHDPRVDDMALMEALKTTAFYIGAMGSERTSASRRERLPELGLTAAEIAKLHAPIGFQIESKTPAEIAIAIMAQVTSVRHKGDARRS
ncbi:MAG: XdhC family protein [Gammaproteobacteria bacterium]|nr:XdhC family protein [Gammaproteobacteria bacterium]